MGVGCPMGTIWSQPFEKCLRENLGGVFLYSSQPSSVHQSQAIVLHSRIDPNVTKLSSAPLVLEQGSYQPVCRSRHLIFQCHQRGGYQRLGIVKGQRAGEFKCGHQISLVLHQRCVLESDSREAFLMHVWTVLCTRTLVVHRSAIPKHWQLMASLRAVGI